MVCEGGLGRGRRGRGGWARCETPWPTTPRAAARDARPEEDIDHAVRQIISRAVAPEDVIDFFAAAGQAKPDISILSD
ncbi:MAG TPA: DUF3387 domain-containing protein, partial [Anaerolineae bacterium]|nr:DUF3387 domain-containing protein [Anaerolineae bacterium]